MRLIIMFRGQREPCFMSYSVFNFIFFFYILPFRLLVQIVKGKRRCHSSATSNVKVNDFHIFPCYAPLLTDSLELSLPWSVLPSHPNSQWSVTHPWASGSAASPHIRQASWLLPEQSQARTVHVRACLCCSVGQFGQPRPPRVSTWSWGCLKIHLYQKYSNFFLVA